MSHAGVRVRHEGAIAIITLDRAEKRNALTRDMMTALFEIARGLGAAEAIRAVILEAEGTDFSVGADLNERRPSADTSPSLLMRRRAAELGGELMRALQEIPQPTICAVKGVATGGGACIATACDFRIAAADARLGYGEVKLGINLMWNALGPCLHLVGPARAKRMIMSGRLFPATTLEAWGFLDAVVPPGDLAATARQWAEDYAALPPIAVQMIKRGINQLSGALDRAVLHMDTDQWMLASQSEDFREAVAAFFAKRQPRFQGN